MFENQSTPLGKHAFFFRDGDLITIPATGSAAGVSGRNNKPDATDPNYNDLDVVEDWSWDNKSMGDEKVNAPSPGRMQAYDLVEKGSELMLKWTSPILQGIAIEIFLRTSQKLTSAGGIFNPNTAPPRKGWIHTELYDNNNNFAMNLDVYGVLRITGGIASKEGTILRPQYEFNVLYSTQAVGLLNND